MYSICARYGFKCLLPEIHLPLRPASWSPHPLPAPQSAHVPAPVPTPAPDPNSAQVDDQNLWPLLIGRAENCRVLQSEGKTKENTRNTKNELGS